MVSAGGVGAAGRHTLWGESFRHVCVQLRRYGNHRLPERQAARAELALGNVSEW